MILRDTLFGIALTGIILAVIGAIMYMTMTRKSIAVEIIKKCYLWWTWIWFYTPLWSIALSNGEVCWSRWMGDGKDLLFTIPGFHSGMYVAEAWMIIELICIHVCYWIEFRHSCYEDVPTETGLRAVLLNVPPVIFVANSLQYGGIAYICLVPMILSFLCSVWVDILQYRAIDRGDSIYIHPTLRRLVDFGYLFNAVLIGCALCA